MSAPAASRASVAALAVLCTVQFMLVLDVAVAAVALVPIQRQLAIADADLQWVTTAYGLAFGGLLIVGGRLADALGGRRTLIVGLAVFTVASLGCAAAQAPWQLFLARGGQGVGAALASPAAMAALLRLFSEGARRNFALGMWGAVAAGGAIAGQVVGGILTQVLGWRSVFWINIPIGIVLIALTWRLLPADRTRRQPVHPTAALVLTGSLALGIFAVTKLPDGATASTMACAGAALVGVLVFALLDRRAKNPLLPPALLHNSSVVIGNAFAICLAGTTATAVYVTSIYLQAVLGLSPLQAGLGFAPVTALILLVSTQTKRLLDHYSLRTVTITGALVTIAGMVHLSMLSSDGHYLTDALPGLLAVGVGSGLTYAPSVIVATTGVPNNLAGAASGLINASQQIGAATLLAATVTILSASTSATPVDGYRAALLAGAALPTLAALLIARLPPAATRTTQQSLHSSSEQM